MRNYVQQAQPATKNEQGNKKKRCKSTRQRIKHANQTVEECEKITLTYAMQLTVADGR